MHISERFTGSGAPVSSHSPNTVRYRILPGIFSLFRDAVRPYHFWQLAVRDRFEIPGGRFLTVTKGVGTIPSRFPIARFRHLDDCHKRPRLSLRHLGRGRHSADFFFDDFQIRRILSRSCRRHPQDKIPMIRLDLGFAASGERGQDQGAEQAEAALVRRLPNVVKDLPH